MNKILALCFTLIMVFSSDLYGTRRGFSKSVDLRKALLGFQAEQRFIQEYFYWDVFCFLGDK